VALTIHPHLAPKVKERLKLYLYAPSGPSWPVKVRILRFFCLWAHMSGGAAVNRIFSSLQPYFIFKATE
jgi:hypothetical protein